MSIILIGMPGAGKTTLGCALAETLALPFVDTDALIEQQLGGTLQEGLDALGYLKMRELEEEVILCHRWPDLPLVIATGGSVVYSAKAMERLEQLGLRVYLQISLGTVKTRVHNWHSRGFSKAPEQSLESVFAEREALYQRYSDAELGCDGLEKQQGVRRLLEFYQGFTPMAKGAEVTRRP